MKNYWLDKKNDKCFVSTGEFEQAVIAFQDKPTPETARNLSRIYKILAENILSCFGSKIEWTDRKQVVVECMRICFEKVARFDRNKGKAFNYFVTIMLGHMRQMYRSQKNYKELKQKYAQFLAGKERGEGSRHEEEE